MTIFFQLVHVTLLWLLEFAPYPELFIYPYLVFSGFRPYADILDQHFPGFMFFPINFFTLGFRDPVSFHALHTLVIILTSALIYKLTHSRLAVLFYTLWQPFFAGNELWLDIFLPLFTAPAFYFFSSRRYLAAGLFLGLGVVFKQTLVPLVAFAGLLLLRHRQVSRLAKFSLAAILPSALMLAYFSRIGLLRDFWYWTIQFNLTAYASSGKLAPTWGQIAKLSLPAAFLVLAFFRLPQLRLTLGWLVFTLIGGVARFDFIHLQPAVPYLAIVLAALSSSSRKIMLAAFAVTLVWLGYFYSRPHYWRQTKYFDSSFSRLAQSVSRLTAAGDKIFVLGTNPHLYSLTRTLPPGQTFIFQFPWFMQTAGQRIQQTLISDPPKLIIYNPESVTAGQYLRDYASYLVEYTQDNYQLSDEVGQYQIYARRP